jgi:hypothetical protein
MQALPQRCSQEPLSLEEEFMKKEEYKKLIKFNYN